MSWREALALAGVAIVAGLALAYRRFLRALDRWENSRDKDED